MQKVLIINAHQRYPFAGGKLNATLVDTAKDMLEANAYEVKTVDMIEDWDIQEQLELHQWADVIILQSPVNWMGVPWRFKQYMDEVYTAGMGGELCNGDGRNSSEPKANYGNGGALKGKKYMLSLTFNAPRESFDDEKEYLFQGKSVDDLFFPMHMNFRFFGMQSLPTFACFDVMKDPKIDADLERFKAHIKAFFIKALEESNQ
jgi:modulator of drug activity B